MGETKENRRDCLGRRGRGVLATLAVVATLVTPQPASAQEIYVGTCVLTVTATATAPLNPLDALAPTTVGITGQGDCLVDGQGHLLTVSGTLTIDTGLWSCVGGAWVEALRYEVPGLFEVNASTAVVATAASLTLTAASADPLFTGTGELVREPGQATDCLDGSATTMTWSGPFAFTYISPGVAETGRSAAP